MAAVTDHSHWASLFALNSLMLGIFLGLEMEKRPFYPPVAAQQKSVLGPVLIFVHQIMGAVHLKMFILAGLFLDGR